MAYDESSRIEQKRSHKWFMDGVEPELLPNKKQAVEVLNHNSFSGLLNSNISPWDNAFNFHSFAGRLFNPETGRTVNFDGGNAPLVGVGNMSMTRKLDDDPFESDSSFGLSISHTLDDPSSGISNAGIRKVKVSQVKETENIVPVMYDAVSNDTMSTHHAFSNEDSNSVSMSHSYNRGDNNMISVGDTFSREGFNFLPMVQTFGDGEKAGIPVGDTFKEDNSSVSVHQLKCESNITTMGHTFNEGEGSTISMGHMFKENDCVVSMGQSYSKDGITAAKMGQISNQGDGINISMGHSNRAEENTSSVDYAFSKVENSSLSMGNSFGNGESTIISFGGFDDDGLNASGRLISNYDLLMGQSSVQRPGASGKGLIELNSDVLMGSSQIITHGESVAKKEEKPSKKPPPNSFPSNVRSLLSTGMFDGVPVKYIAWSREKELRGVIRGSGYLCGCQSCNFSKAVNAYEFERHAECKTKHPNNHIYFESGKTIYGIVQELRNTPQNLLFEVVQSITGSPINQKSFRVWKESFLAATRELQRIYGKDEGK